MECLFRYFLAGMSGGPVTQRGDTGCEEYGRMLWGLARDLDHVAHTGDVGLEGLEAKIEIDLPLVVFHLGR